ncbi:hypothetical protein F4779DRAFT_608649 [Xylariaceae sp. FL0662B]|nr:hypothetical protein F4779DRAFT_608649 [Xylariaceae sp. FL0662B]
MAKLPKPSKSVSTSVSVSTTESVPYTRLHITPLDQSLLSVVIPSSVLPNVRNISYHTIEAFPEKRYGFVDLPTTEADKLNKKLNGAVLRGAKMRIEKARPETIPEPTAMEEADTSKPKKDKKKDRSAKKRKRDVDVTPGVQLEGRKVKRGWTTSEQEMIEEKRKKTKRDKEKKEKKPKDKDGKKGKKDKKKTRDVKSKYTDAPECLFKTKLPDAVSSVKDSEEAAEHKKKRKRKGERDVVVHEFERTVKHPSFLKANTEMPSAEAMTFEDGVGWVDSKGIVIETAAASKRSNARVSKLDSTEAKQPVSTAADFGDDTTSSSGSSSSSSSSSEDEDEDEDEGVSAQNAEAASSDEKETPTPASGPSKKLKIETQVLSSPTSALKTTGSAQSARPKSSGSVTSLTIKIPPATPAASKVHPLEALYKRPVGNAATTPSQDTQPFSFFDDDDLEGDEEDGAAPRAAAQPLTPFSKQDFEFRNVRSAAPTPDTAHPSRTFSMWSRTETTVDEAEEEAEEAEEDPNENSDGEDVAMTGTSNVGTAIGDAEQQTPVSDFQKQFWENRGDLNRSWRRRRKTAAKEKRYRENRARAARAI